MKFVFFDSLLRPLCAIEWDVFIEKNSFVRWLSTLELIRRIIRLKLLERSSHSAHPSIFAYQDDVELKRSFYVIILWTSLNTPYSVLRTKKVPSYSYNFRIDGLSPFYSLQFAK